MRTVTYHLPNESWTQSSHEGTDTFCSPNYSNAIEGGFVLLACGWRESICLHPRLDHIYWVYHRPELE